MSAPGLHPVLSPNPSRISIIHVSSAARREHTHSRYSLVSTSTSLDVLHVREIDSSNNVPLRTECGCDVDLLRGYSHALRHHFPLILFYLVDCKLLLSALCVPMYSPAAPDLWARAYIHVATKPVAGNATYRPQVLLRLATRPFPSPRILFATLVDPWLSSFNDHTPVPIATRGLHACHIVWPE